MKEKGITLIALVITIIVLLILAGVSIATLTGDNGILTQATKAKEETEIATDEEQRQLSMAEAAMNFENTEYNGVTIPAGFAPTRIEGESTVDEGLVMVDSKGNSYVWIEVPKSIYNDEEYTTSATNVATIPNSSTDYDNIEKILQNYAEDYRTNGYSDAWGSEGRYGFERESDYNDLKHKMLKSVYENGGFWVGQYEVGYEQGINRACRSYELNEEEYKKEHPIDEIPVIKANAYPYTWVTGRQAQQLANGMDSGNYTSSLMFGIQWDLMLKFIEEKKAKTQEELKNLSSWGNFRDASFIVKQGKYSDDNGKSFKEVSGNYKKPEFPSDGQGILLTTGATKRNSALNIYDIAGNVWEFTLEAYNNNYLPCVRRGSYYGDPGNTGSKRLGYDALQNKYGQGFRTTLF